MGVQEEQLVHKEVLNNRLIELDRERGWDTVERLNWDEEVDNETAQSHRRCAQQMMDDEPRTLERAPAGERVLIFSDEEDDAENAIVTEDDEEYFSACETLGDDLIIQPLSRNRHRGADSFNAVDHARVTPADEGRTNQSLDEGETFELLPAVIAYIEHRFGPRLDYEQRCFCHDWLVDAREQRNNTLRMYYAQSGTVLPIDGCTLREYPQDDMPGTEGMEKPLVTVTTPDGKVLWPHDEQGG